MPNSEIYIAIFEATVPIKIREKAQIKSEISLVESAFLPLSFWEDTRLPKTSIRLIPQIIDISKKPRRAYSAKV